MRRIRIRAIPGAGMMLAGLAGAGVTLLLPVGVIETLVASSGLSEAIPAAAPPLGMKARLLVAMFAAVMAAGLTATLGRADRIDGEGRAHRAQGARKMGFAFSKLTALARGRAADGDASAPAQRRADAHPDAPPRPPIFASRDFDGVEIFARPRGARPLSAAPVAGDDRGPGPGPGPAVAFTPLSSAPEVPADATPAFVRQRAEAPYAQDWTEADTVDPVQAMPDVEEAVHVPIAEPAPAPAPRRLPTQGLSVQELTERLERGLAQRVRAKLPPLASGGVIADMPAAPAVPVRDTVSADTDAALRAALGALRSMTGRQ